MDEAAVVFRFALGTIFLLSGIAKLANREQFDKAVAEYRVLPVGVSRLVARLIPPLETALGAFMLLGLATEATAVGIILLLSVFSAAMTINLIRGRRISCGCFGTLAQREISWLAVMRNIALLGLAVIVAWRNTPVLALDNYVRPAPASIAQSAALPLVVAGTLVALLTSLLEESVSVLRMRRRFESDRLAG